MPDGAVPQPRKPGRPLGSKNSYKFTRKSAQAAMPYVEKPILNEEGAPTGRTLPIQEMTLATYKREARVQTLAYRNFLRSRKLDDLKLALARDGGPRATRFLEALTDPANKDIDIAVLAEQCRISFTDLITVWRSDKLMEAVGHLFDGVPKVAEHIAKDAESSQSCCPRCDGAGVMKVQRSDTEYEWIQCVNCSGTGAVRKYGDTKSRQYILESTGIIKGGGSAVTVNVNSGVSSAVESVLDEMDGVTISATAMEMDT